MSYVPDEFAAVDPDFWKLKPPGQYDTAAGGSFTDVLFL